MLSKIKNEAGSFLVELLICMSLLGIISVSMSKTSLLISELERENRANQESLKQTRILQDTLWHLNFDIAYKELLKTCKEVETSEGSLMRAYTCKNSAIPKEVGFVLQQ